MADVSKIKTPDGTSYDLADQECRANLNNLNGSLATVARSGSYTDLSNKPTVAVIDDSVTVFDKAWSSKNIDKTFVHESGDTMTGQLKTSFKSSVAMGSYGSSQTTIPNLCNEIRMSSGCTGSVSITTAFTKSSVTIPTGWYNYIYSPHRSGGKNGNADGDNCNYGTLILSSMTSSTPRTFILRVSSSSSENYVNSLREIWTTNQGHVVIGGTLVVTFNGSGTRDVAISNFTGLSGKPTNMMVSCQSASAAFIDYDYDNSSDTTIRLNAVGLTSSGTYQKLNGNYRIGWMAMV